MDSGSERADTEGLSDALESDAGKMKDRADALGSEISEVREDWRQKQQDSGLPGAEPPGKPFADHEPDAASPTGGEEGGPGQG